MRLDPEIPDRRAVSQVERKPLMERSQPVSRISGETPLRRRRRPASRLWLHRPALVAAGIGLHAVADRGLMRSDAGSRASPGPSSRALAATELIVLQNGINEYLSRLVALRTLFESANEEITRSEFEVFSGRLFENHPGLLRVGWLPKVYRKERAEYEAAAVNDGIAGYRIKSFSRDGAVSPAPPSELIFPGLLFHRAENLAGLRAGLFDRSDAVGDAGAFAGQRRGRGTAHPAGLRSERRHPRRSRQRAGLCEGHVADDDRRPPPQSERLCRRHIRSGATAAIDPHRDGGILRHRRQRLPAGSGPQAPVRNIAALPIFVRAAKRAASIKAFATGAPWSGALRIGDANWQVLAVPAAGRPADRALRPRPDRAGRRPDHHHLRGRSISVSPAATRASSHWPTGACSSLRRSTSDRASQPGVFSRAIGGGGRCARAPARRDVLGPDARSRPLQERQRFAGPRRRRRPAAARWRAGCDRRCAAPTCWRGSAATNSPSSRRAATISAAVRSIWRRGSRKLDRRAVPVAGPSGRGRHQHRHRDGAGARRRSRAAAEEGRPCAVPLEIGRPQLLHASTTTRCRPNSRRATRWKAICATPSRAASSKCIISRSSTSRAGAGRVSRRWCAGVIRPGAWSRPTSSFRSRKRPG